MINDPTAVKALVASAALLTGAALFIRLLPSLAAAWRKATGLGRCLFAFGVLTLSLYAGTKTNAVPPRLAAPRRASSAAHPSVPYRVLTGVKAWPDAWFAMPADATTFEPWTRRGAVDDWTPVSVGGETHVALVGGVLRQLPREWIGELGLASTAPDGAVPGQSRLWWKTESCGAHVVTWEKFHKAGRDTPHSLQLRIWNDTYEIRTNGVFDMTHVAYNPTEDECLDLRLSAPHGVFVGGDRRPLSLSCSSGRAIEGRIRLEQRSGRGCVSLWTASVGGTSVSLPLDVDAATFEGASYYVQADAPSGTTNDVSFAATLVGDGPDPQSVLRSVALTSVRIDRIDVRSDAQGVSTNPPPFEPGVFPVFDIEKSVTPDRHLVIPFGNVATAALGVSNFAIRAEIVVSPSEYDEPVAWARLTDTPVAGTFAGTGFAQDLVRPDRGGVYRFAANVGGIICGWTAVLPLASPELRETVEEDLLRADDFVAWARDRFPSNLWDRVSFGLRYFCTHDNGYYLGRPDAADAAERTVWQYNQVNAAGKGAVMTLAGFPTRLEKMSNLVCAYTCEKLGVSAVEQWIAQSFGTANDETATMSWNAGVRLAHEFRPDLALPTVASNMWQRADAKVKVLWPNHANPCNISALHPPTNYDYLFFSPGFLLYGL